MRILQVISGLKASSGGPTTALLGLTRALSGQGAQVTICASQRAGEPVAGSAELVRAGVRVEVVAPCRGPLQSHPDMAATLRRLAAEHDLVHIHGVWEDIQFQAARAAKVAGIPFIIRPCGLLDAWSLARKPWKKRLYRWWRLDRMLAAATAIHCTTAMEAESTARVTGTTPMIIEPNGIDLSEFETLPSRGRFRAELGLGSEPLVLFLGRVHPGKGLEYLVPAFARMTKRDAILVVVGHDAEGYGRTIARLASQHGVADRVRFVGPLAGGAKVQALVDADVLSLPSEHENFGNVVVEALAAGCPVVVSDQVGAGTEVAAQRIGSVVPLDPVAIAASIDGWLADPDRRRVAGAAGRAFVFERFAWARIAAAWLDRYEAMIVGTVPKTGCPTSSSPSRSSLHDHA